MKTIQVSSHSKTVNALLQQARSGGVILRTADGLAFILAEIDDFDQEIDRTCQNEELIAFLVSRAQQTKTVSSTVARARLGLTNE